MTNMEKIKRLSHRELMIELEKAQKDPNFIKFLKEFIKETTR